MLTLFDYPASQNAWKVRQLLQHLQRPYHTVNVSIFEGEGRSSAYLHINPTGTVPAIQLDDGRVLSESNAILFYLATDTAYLPVDAFGRAKVQQWLSFEQERIESVIGSLRYWALTGKLAQRPAALVDMKRKGALRSLAILEGELAQRPFLLESGYSIADIAMFAYTHRGADAEIDMQPYVHLRAWMDRVTAQPGFLATVHPYADDPHSRGELP